MQDTTEEDEQGGAEPTLDDGQGTHTPPILEVGDDLEHQRVYHSLYKKLFGHGDELEIGGFRVLRRLGAGGMGEVFLCEDLRLGRKVAVKRVIGGGSELEQERLRREARALAALAHDNIVRVYEIGEHEGDLFVVMEYIEGEHLGQWLSTGPDASTSVPRLVDAGRGLAAAHEAGFIHRDFKPENVLMGADGGVKVADFGLVLARGERARRVIQGAAVGASLSARLSVGTVLGTALFMAPEQLRGEEADARSDQFSFCLVAYEALWRAPPFTVTSVGERLAAMEAGRVLRPAGQRGLYRVIRRGLAANPAQRWESMNALLQALERAGRAPRRRRRGLLTALGGAGFGVLASVGWIWLAAQAPSSCERLAERAWGAISWDTLDSLGQGLEAKERAGALARVREGLDRWRERQGEACEVSPELHPCLEAQSRRVEVFVDELLTGEDPEILVTAAVAVRELPDPERCRVGSGAGLFDGAEEATPRELAQLRGALDELHALRLLGQWDDARLREKELEARAHALAHGPLLAEVLAEGAKLEDEAGDRVLALERYRKAEALALRHGEDALAAELGLEWAELAMVEPGAEAEVGQVLRWIEPLRKRTGLGPWALARQLSLEARLADNAGQRGEARKKLHGAIAIAERAGDGAAGLDASAYLSTLAELSTGAEARELHRRALELAEAAFGPTHPRTATYLYNYGAALSGTAEDAKGRALRQRATELWARHAPKNAQASNDQSWVIRRAVDQAAELLADKDLEGVERQAQLLEQLLADRNTDRNRGMPDFLRAKVRATQAGLPATLDTRRGPLREEALGFAERAILTSQRVGAAKQTRDGRKLRVNLLLALGRLDEASVAAAEYAAAVRGLDLEASLAALSRAEIALRLGELREADEQLREAEPRREELHPSDLTTYEALRALCDLRLARADSGRRPSEAPELPEPHRVWLRDELGLDSGERAFFGLDAKG